MKVHIKNPKRSAKPIDMTDATILSFLSSLVLASYVLGRSTCAIAVISAIEEGFARLSSRYIP